MIPERVGDVGERVPFDLELNDRCDIVSERVVIHLRRVAFDHTLLFEVGEVIRNCRHRNVEFLAETAEARPSVTQKFIH